MEPTQSRLLPRPLFNGATLGLVAGDRVAICDDSAAWHTRNVVSATDAGVIVYDGAALTVGGYASAVVIIPNREIVSSSSVAPSGVCAEVGAKVEFKGVVLSTDVTRGSGSGKTEVVKMAPTSFVCVQNVLVDARAQGDGVYMNGDSILHGIDGSDVLPSAFLLGAGNLKCVTNDGNSSAVRSGDWFLSGVAGLASFRCH